jgi:hypothetical protein
MGDMLDPQLSDLQQCAAYVSGDEVKTVCDYLREQGDPECGRDPGNRAGRLKRRTKNA